MSRLDKIQKFASLLKDATDHLRVGRYMLPANVQE